MRNRVFSLLMIALFSFFLLPSRVSACILWQTAEYENYMNQSYLLGSVTLIIAWMINFWFFKRNPPASEFRWVKMVPVMIILLILLVAPLILYYFLGSTFDPLLAYFTIAFIFILVILPAFIINLAILWGLRKKGWFLSQSLFLPSLYGILIPVTASLLIIGAEFILFPFTGDVNIPCPPGP